MLLKNFYNALGSWMEGASPENLVLVTGTAHSYTTTSPNKLSTMTHIHVGNTTLSDYYFGDGDAEPKFDDYNLSGNRITTLTGTVTKKRTQDDTGITIEHNFTVTNTGQDVVTLKEIGFTSGIGSSNPAMIWKDLLSNPITLEPNGVGQITHTVKLTYPTA